MSDINQRNTLLLIRNLLSLTPYYSIIYPIFVSMNLEQLQYPIGQCVYPVHYTDTMLKSMLLDIETFPARLEMAVQTLDEYQLQTTYRDGGWTVNQVIHHCGDSHMNCLMRIKFALTEDVPTIKPYMEDKWAQCADYYLPFNNSLTLLYCIHRKIIALVNALSPLELDRSYYHQQDQREFRIKDVICLYAWHGNHHLAHITSLKERMTWY